MSEKAIVEKQNLCAKRMGDDKELTASLADGGYSLTDFQERVRNKCSSIDVLTKPSEGGLQPCSTPWVADILVPAHEEGETWEAIVSGADGKTYCVKFMIAGDDIAIVGAPDEVIRETDYDYVNQADEAAYVEGRNALLKAKARKDDGKFSADTTDHSLEAFAAKKIADKSGSKDDHAKASGLFQKAADKFKKNGQNRMAGVHQEFADEHKAAMEACETVKAEDMAGEDGLEGGAPIGNQNAVGPHGSYQVKHAIECASNAMRSIVPEIDNILMYMPGGTHEITPSQNGKPVTVTVSVDAKSAEVLESQRRKLEAAGKKPFFSIQHDTEIAAFWPSEFFWDKRIDKTGSFVEGVWARGEWTKSGREAVEGKDFRTFSPTFFVDAIRNSADKPAKVICEDGARPNMGALENDPAFQSISPLWARNAGVPANNKPNGDNMENKETIAELQARQTKLEADILALQAKGEDAIAKEQLKAKQAEQREINAQVRLAQMEEKNKALEAAESKRKEEGAETAVQAMVSSGAIPVRDVELQATYKAKFITDPTLIPLMASKGVMRGNELQGGRTAKGAEEGQALIAYGGIKEGANRVLKAVAALCARQSAIRGNEPVDRKQRSELALEAAMIYQGDIRSKNFDANGFPLMNLEYVNAPLQAAADSDTLGTLVGTLVTQRMLDLFRYQFPMLSRVMTDFSDEPSEFNQTVTTRKVLVPSVQSFDNTLDTDNRPKGWGTASNGQTTDISISMDELVGVPIPFSMATLSSTQRKLFMEQAPAGVYALVKYFIAKAYAVCTAANFNAYAAVTAADGQGVVKVPVAYATFPVSSLDFGRNAVTKIGAAFDANEVPDEDRSLLLNANFYAAGTRDPSLVTFFAGQQAPGLITDGVIPRLNNFGLIKAPNFPGSAARVGIAIQKNGLLLKSRLPVNYMDVLPGAGNGSITQITDAQTGFSMMLIQYVNNTRGFAEWLPCAIIGAAKGDTRGGLVITGT